MYVVIKIWTKNKWSDQFLNVECWDDPKQEIKEDEITNKYVKKEWMGWIDFVDEWNCFTYTVTEKVEELDCYSSIAKQKRVQLNNYWKAKILYWKLIDRQ